MSDPEISPAEKLRKLVGVLQGLPVGEKWTLHRDVVLCDALEIIADALHQHHPFAGLAGTFDGPVWNEVFEALDKRRMHSQNSQEM